MIMTKDRHKLVMAMIMIMIFLFNQPKKVDKIMINIAKKALNTLTTKKIKSS